MRSAGSRPQFDDAFAAIFRADVAVEVVLVELLDLLALRRG